jgi:hypothetical protein
MAQDLSQMGQQAKEKIGGAIGQFMDGNQTGNQSGIKQVTNQVVLGNSIKLRVCYRANKIVSSRLLLRL